MPWWCLWCWPAIQPPAVYYIGARVLSMDHQRIPIVHSITKVTTTDDQVVVRPTHRLPQEKWLVTVLYCSELCEERVIEISWKRWLTVKRGDYIDVPFDP